MLLLFEEQQQDKVNNESAHLKVAHRGLRRLSHLLVHLHALPRSAASTHHQRFVSATLGWVL